MTSSKKQESNTPQLYSVLSSYQSQTKTSQENKTINKYLMIVEVKHLNKTLANQIQQGIKIITHMTKWDIYYELMGGPTCENPLVSYTVLMEQMTKKIHANFSRCEKKKRLLTKSNTLS